MGGEISKPFQIKTHLSALERKAEWNCRQENLSSPGTFIRRFINTLASAEGPKSLWTLWPIFHPNASKVIIVDDASLCSWDGVQS